MRKGTRVKILKNAHEWRRQQMCYHALGTCQTGMDRRKDFSLDTIRLSYNYERRKTQTCAGLMAWIGKFAT